MPVAHPSVRRMQSQAESCLAEPLRPWPHRENVRVLKRLPTDPTILRHSHNWQNLSDTFHQQSERICSRRCNPSEVPCRWLDSVDTFRSLRLGQTESG